MSMKLFWEGKVPDGEVVRLAACIGPLVRLLAGLQSGDIEVGEDSWDIGIVLDTVSNLYWNLGVDDLDELSLVDPIRGPMPDPDILDVLHVDGRRVSRKEYIEHLIKVITRLNGCIEKRGWEVVRRGNSSLDWGLAPLKVESATS